MPLYYFHTRGVSVFRDIIGTELASFSAARVEVFKLAGRLMADDPTDFDNDEGWFLDLTDPTGLILFMLQVHGTIPSTLRRELTGAM